MSAEPSNAGRGAALKISELNAIVKEVVEGTIPPLWVQGEIADLARPRSGHLYFSLTDGECQVRACIWRASAERMRIDLHDGLSVLCFGQVTVYAPRGTYQLEVRRIEPLGVGAKELALQQLKLKLAAEGLFAAERKRPLPRFPCRVGLVTSTTGAALHDFLEVSRRRWQAAQVIVIPTRVQGGNAPEEIVRAIQIAQRIAPPLDVLVIARGGGSIDDLAAFNTEVVVRAVADSDIPTVSAVGHEIDVTLCDLAADQRALTPSEAAERVFPVGDDLRRQVSEWRDRSYQAVVRSLGQRQQRLDNLISRPVLERPNEILLWEHRRKLEDLERRAAAAWQSHQNQYRHVLHQRAANLNVLNPLQVLARGYSMTHRLDASGQRLEPPLVDPAAVSPGARLETQLADGKLWSVVIPRPEDGE
jgi:exodeoxyribonuclease VII large subunit